MLEKEKGFRKKGFADRQVEEMVKHLRGRGIETAAFRMLEHIEKERKGLGI